MLCIFLVSRVDIFWFGEGVLWKVCFFFWVWVGLGKGGWDEVKCMGLGDLGFLGHGEFFLNFLTVCFEGLGLG